jgi:hypothetical protein
VLAPVPHDVRSVKKTEENGRKRKKTEENGRKRKKTGENGDDQAIA